MMHERGQIHNHFKPFFSIIIRFIYLSNLLDQYCLVHILASRAFPCWTMCTNLLRFRTLTIYSGRILLEIVDSTWISIAIFVSNRKYQLYNLDNYRSVINTKSYYFLSCCKPASKKKRPSEDALANGTVFVEILSKAGFMIKTKNKPNETCKYM